MADPIAFKYRAFLSYSHANSAWAKWLHKQIENFRIDKDLAGKETALGPIPKSLRPVFRDRDEFTGGQELGEATVAALDTSAALIVLCSPASAKSRYVNEEVRLFKSRHPKRPIVPVLVDGEPPENFPQALRYEVMADGTITDKEVTILGADLREDRDGRQVGLAKTVAGLTGLTTDEIVRRAAREQRRRLRNWIAGLTVVIVALAGLTLWAEVNRREASNQKTIAVARQYLALAQLRQRTNAECSLILAIKASQSASLARGLDVFPFNNAVRNAAIRTHVAKALPNAPKLPVSRSALSWTSGGDKVFFVTNEGRIQTWAPETDAIEGFGVFANIVGIESDPMGQSLALLMPDDVEIWDGEGTALKRKFEIKHVARFTWNPTGTKALATSAEGIFLLDLSDGTQRKLAPGNPNLAGGRGHAWSPDGSLVAYAAYNDEFVILDPQTNKSQTFKNKQQIDSLAWSPDGKWIAVGLEKGQINIWDVASQALATVLDGHDNQVATLAFSPDGSKLLSGSWDRSLRTWYVRDWTSAGEFTGHTGAIYLARWHPKQARFASMSTDGTLRIWTADASRVSKIAGESNGWIWNVAWVSDHQLLATADFELLEYDSAKDISALVAAPPPNPGPAEFTSGAAAPLKSLYAFTDNFTVKVADFSTHSIIFDQTVGKDDEWVRAVALSEDGSQLAVGTLKRIFILSLPKGELVAQAPIPSVAYSFSPANALLGIAAYGGAVAIVDIKERKEVHHLTGLSPQKATWGISWHPSGQKIAASSDDGTAMIWSIEKPEPALVLRGHSAEVKGVAWSPSGDRLATASLDRTVRIWDGATGAPIAVLEGHRSGVRTVAWSRDGKTIAAGGEDGVVRIFSTDWDEVLKRAEEQARSGSIPEERTDCLNSAQTG